MTFPAVIRIFFAIDLPEATKKTLSSFIGMLKKESKTHAIRWSKGENLHITLQFLPEIRSEHVPPLIEHVSAVLKNAHQHSWITLGGLHLFPHPYRPRVIVLDVSPQDELSMLSNGLGGVITDLGYEIEDRPFRGHLTLGRIKQPQGVNLNFLSTMTVPQIERIELKEVVLFRSEPQPDGSKYSALARIPIGSPIAEVGCAS